MHFCSFKFSIQISWNSSYPLQLQFSQKRTNSTLSSRLTLARANHLLSKIVKNTANCQKLNERKYENYSTKVHVVVHETRGEKNRKQVRSYAKEQIERRARTRRNSDTRRVLIKFSLAEYSRLARFSSPGHESSPSEEARVINNAKWFTMLPRLLANETSYCSFSFFFFFFPRLTAAMRTNFHMNPG